MCLIRLYAKQSQSKHKVLREQTGRCMRKGVCPQTVSICCVCMCQPGLFTIFEPLGNYKIQPEDRNFLSLFSMHYPRHSVFLSSPAPLMTSWLASWPMFESLLQGKEIKGEKKFPRRLPALNPLPRKLGVAYILGTREVPKLQTPPICMPMPRILPSETHVSLRLVPS